MVGDPPYEALAKVEASDLQPLQAAVGRGILIWQQVESGLLDVLRSMLPANVSNDTAKVIFFTPRDFSLKLEIVHRIIRVEFGEDLDNNSALRQKWTSLRKRAIRASEDRNSLAHFQIAHVTDLSDGGIKETRLAVLPNFEDITFDLALERATGKDRKKLASKIGGELDTDAITAIAQEFSQLAAELRQFASDVRTYASATSAL